MAGKFKGGPHVNSGYSKFIEISTLSRQAPGEGFVSAALGGISGMQDALQIADIADTDRGQALGRHLS